MNETFQKVNQIIQVLQMRDNTGTSTGTLGDFTVTGTDRQALITELVKVLTSTTTTV
jgi:hypothetical protein